MQFLDIGRICFILKNADVHLKPKHGILGKIYRISFSNRGSPRLLGILNYGISYIWENAKKLFLENLFKKLFPIVSKNTKIMVRLTLCEAQGTHIISAPPSQNNLKLPNSYLNAHK